MPRPAGLTDDLTAFLAAPDDRWIVERRRRELRAAREHEAETREECSTLYGFVKRAWHIVEPDAEFSDNWHIKIICDHLEAVTWGKINRLLINVPPGSMKSLLVSVMWPAWEWGPAGKPHLRYLTTSFNDVPVKRDVRKTRDLIMSPWYQTLWRVKMTRKAEFSYANSDTGSREGVAFGSLTSQRGDRLIIDDPHSVKTAESDTQRGETTSLFASSARNRLNDQQRSAIIVIMQRLHTDDVSGWIIKHDPDYVHLCLPMEFDPSERCVTRIGFRDPRKKEGELLDPRRFPKKVCESLKLAGAYFWAGQYQQRPAPKAGGFFKIENIGRAKSPPVNGRRVRAWDLAATEVRQGTDPDYTAGVLMARCTDTRKFYILDVKRFRKSAGAVRTTIIATASADAAAQETTVHIPQDPGQAGKDQAEDYGRQLAGYPIKIERVDTVNKETRADPFAAQVELGNVVIVETGDILKDAWIQDFEHELRTFPVGHDDQVDAAADAFKMLAGAGAQGWFDYYAELHAEQEKAKGQR